MNTAALFPHNDNLLPDIDASWQKSDRNLGAEKRKKNNNGTLGRWGKKKLGVLSDFPCPTLSCRNGILDF